MAVEEVSFKMARTPSRDLGGRVWLSKTPPTHDGLHPPQRVYKVSKLHHQIGLSDQKATL